jgi:hypothetical protein
MTSLRDVAKRVIPTSMVDAYRRRRALRAYLKSISQEIYDRNRMFELEELEGDLLVRRPDITGRLMKDLIMRTDILIQQLDRQIEALRARHGGELRELRTEVDALHASLHALRAELGLQPPPPGSTAGDARPAQSPAGRSASGD